MAENVPDWAKTEEPPPPPEDVPDWAQEELPSKAKPTQQAKKIEPEMPTLGSAFMQGTGAGFRHAGEGIQTIRGKEVKESAAPESPAAAPLEWSDVTSPISKLAPKLAYGLGESAPTLAGGIAGGMAGSAVAPGAGTLIGGATGAAAGAALQTISPYFQDELKKSPQDPDGAWTRAMERAGASGAFSGASWAAFPLRAFSTPLKNIAFQALGIQPGLSAAGQATQNVIQGKPITEDVGQAAVQGAVGTAIPMAGHAALSAAARRVESVAAARAKDPILSRLGDPEDIQKGVLAGWRDKLTDIYTAAKDELNPVRTFERAVAEGQPIPNDLSPYVAARLTRGSYGKAEHFVDFATFDPVTGQNNGKGLKQILDPIADKVEDFRKLLLAKTTVERAIHGKPTGVPVKESIDFIKNAPQDLKTAFSGWQKYNDNMLTYMVKAGIMSHEGAARMRAMHQDFAPVYRLMDDPNALDNWTPGSGLRVRNPFKGAHGNEELKILDPIETTIRNTYLYLSIADRNMALQKMQNLAAISPRGNELLQKVPKPVHPISVSTEETNRAMRQQGITTSAEPDPFTIFRPNAFRPAADEIRIYNNGKPTVYKVDPRLGAAVNAMDRESIGTLTKLLSIPAKTLRAGATLSPEFIARNPVRDQFSAFIFSTLGRGYVPFYDMVKGAGQVLTKGEGYQNWLKSGGANSAMVSIDRNYLENLVRSMKDPSLSGTVKNLVKSPLEILRVASELMENATRVGENMRMIKRGASLPEAGYASREVTLDFQRMGSKMRGVNSIIAFFNAQLEGVDRMFRSMAEQPLGFAAKVFASVFLPSLYFWNANKDDPRIREIPRWEKDMFWLVATDNWQPISEKDARSVPPSFLRKNKDGQTEINKGNIYRIPKPFEIGVVFGSVPERILDAYYHKDPKAFKNIGESLRSAFLPNFVPQVVSPVVEQYANKSLFTGRPLVPKYLEGVLPKYEANPYTTDTAKKIGQYMSSFFDTAAGKAVESLPMGEGIKRASSSPIMVENYIRAWTGGLGKHALDLSDAFLRGSGITPTPISPTLTNADKAGLKAFAVRFPEGGANSVQDFYEESEKRHQVKKSVDLLRKSGQKEEAADLQRNNTIAAGDGIKTAMGAQFKMIRNAYQDPKQTPDEKRKFIDMSYLQIIKMAQAGNELFKRTEDQFKAKKDKESQQ